MKISFKLDLKVETVHKISVDDKCFPLIGGVHPYKSKSDTESPLIRESALWFTTLALDTIYVDCDRCLIFWTSVQNDVGQEVLLRKQSTKPVSSHDFIPTGAKPLFEDFTLFDFDASLKEMMGKCREIAGKLNRKSHSAADINSKIANLLHVYILPSVKFTTDDLYALSRARCLIEERLMRADSEISVKASGKHLLEISLDNLKDNLIQTYDFESESYIRTCDPTFLKLFLKKIEEDSTVLNLNLAAEQSKVNWAKDHPNEYCLEDIKDLQSKRNEVHAEVEKLIKVRESLRNVVTRKEKFKKKKKGKATRPKQIEGCFHSIYIEINRRWEVDMKVMDQLVLDKVNISGAREATLSAILELGSTENSRNSERSTQFMPVDFSDCHYDVSGKEEKTSNWLTLQERVCNLLQNSDSSSHKLYFEGCTLITSQIDLALSEFHLVDTQKKPVANSVAYSSVNVNVDNDSTVQLRRSVSPVSMEIRERRSGFVMKDDRKDLGKSVMQKNFLDGMKSSTLPHSRSKQDREMALKRLAPKDENSVTLQDLTNNVNNSDKTLSVYPDHFSLTKNSGSAECSYDSIPDSVTDCQKETSFTMSWEAGATAKLLALKELTQVTERVKIMIRDHFRDVINCLQIELEDVGEDTVVVDMYIDRNELIWKAYERYFSEKVLPSLAILYEASLIESIANTYDNISRTSKHELLEGDKILSLFFDNEAAEVNAMSVRTKERSDSNKDTYSMARTVSDFSLNILDCSIKDLYALTNADSDDVCKRFNLLDEPAVISTSGSSSDSGTSVKTSDLFGSIDCLADVAQATVAGENHPPKGDELANLEDFNKRTSDMESKSSCSDTVFMRPPLSRENSNRASEILNLVLSPFRKQIVKCIKGKGILDKVRYLSKAIEGLNKDISKLYGANHLSVCDDIITMLILALSHMPKDVFIGLYVNLNLLADILPRFLSGSLCEYNIVSLVASYDYLKNRNASQQIVRRGSINKGTE